MIVSLAIKSRRTSGAPLFVFTLFAVSLIAASCSSVPAGEVDATTAADRPAWEYLVERDWALIQMNGELVPGGDRDEAPTLVLSGQGTGRISGFSGVNRYFGSYELGAGSLTLAIAGMTRMAGPPEAMALEQAFIEQANGGSFTYDLAEQTLNLYRDGRLVMMFGLRR